MNEIILTQNITILDFVIRVFSVVGLIVVFVMSIVQNSKNKGRKSNEQKAFQ